VRAFVFVAHECDQRHQRQHYTRNRQALRRNGTDTAQVQAMSNSSVFPEKGIGLRDKAVGRVENHLRPAQNYHEMAVQNAKRTGWERT
jgi:hypothetical protein